MAAVQSPSPFAALLRRSKFASFDPAIAQVYTTYGGDAHRGHWGLKRPLPLRRRNAFITVKSVDSREQQTEWNSGESQARFIKRWDELNVDAYHTAGSAWEKRVGINGQVNWHVDSEFSPQGVPEVEEAPEPKAIDGEVTAANPADIEEGEVKVKDTTPEYCPPGSRGVVNIHSMSKVEFNRYLKKLREKRGEFKEYLKRRGAGDPKLEGKSMYELAQEITPDYHKGFLAQQAADSYSSPTSLHIEQRPHRTGGLTYSHPAPMETLFYNKPQPGFLLQTNVDWKGNKLNTTVGSFAGQTIELKRRDFPDRAPLLDLTSEKGIQKHDIGRSKVLFRLANVPYLLDAPTVVGRVREGVKATKIKMSVADAKQPDFQRANPYTPGSVEYITKAVASSGPKFTPMASAPTAAQKSAQLRAGSAPSQGSNYVVDTLKNILTNQTTDT